MICLFDFNVSASQAKFFNTVGFRQATEKLPNGVSAAAELMIETCEDQLKTSPDIRASIKSFMKLLPAQGERYAALVPYFENLLSVLETNDFDGEAGTTFADLNILAHIPDIRKNHLTILNPQNPETYTPEERHVSKILEAMKTCEAYAQGNGSPDKFSPKELWREGQYLKNTSLPLAIYAYMDERDNPNTSPERREKLDKVIQDTTAKNDRNRARGTSLTEAAQTLLNSMQVANDTNIGGFVVDEDSPIDPEHLKLILYSKYPNLAPTEEIRSKALVYGEPYTDKNILKTLFGITDPTDIERLKNNMAQMEETANAIRVTNQFTIHAMETAQEASPKAIQTTLENAERADPNHLETLISTYGLSSRLAEDPQASALAQQILTAGTYEAPPATEFNKNNKTIAVKIADPSSPDGYSMAPAFVYTDKATGTKNVMVLGGNFSDSCKFPLPNGNLQESEKGGQGYYDFSQAQQIPLTYEDRSIVSRAMQDAQVHSNPVFVLSTPDIKRLEEAGIYLPEEKLPFTAAAQDITVITEEGIPVTPKDSKELAIALLRIQDGDFLSLDSTAAIRNYAAGVLDPQDPQDAKIIEEYNIISEKRDVALIESSPFITLSGDLIEQLSKLPTFKVNSPVAGSAGYVMSHADFFKEAGRFDGRGKFTYSALHHPEFRQKLTSDPLLLVQFESYLTGNPERLALLQKQLKDKTDPEAKQLIAILQKETPNLLAKILPHEGANKAVVAAKPEEPPHTNSGS